MVESTDVLLDAGQEHIADNNHATSQSGSKYKQISRLKSVYFLTIFALFYIGVEVTLGGMISANSRKSEFYWLYLHEGWIVTYIIRQRGGGQSSGYISSGFFGGEYSHPYDSLFRH